MLSENIDKFGLPLTELRQRPNASEDARDRLEKARDEVRRALDELRDVQASVSGNERISTEIKSAINSVIDVEKTLITAVHKVENVIHRSRKGSAKEESVDEKKKPCNEEKISIPFKNEGEKLVAYFDVRGHLVTNDRGAVEWVGEHEVEFKGVKHEGGKEFEGEVPDLTLRGLEDQAADIYADNYFKKHAGK